MENQTQQEANVATTPAPVNPETKFGFTVGQRVYIPRTGQRGVVTGFDERYVNVDRGTKWENENGTNGWYPQSLEPFPGSPSVPVAVEITSGPLSPAPVVREKAFDVGKRIAQKLGTEQRYVTSDNVQSSLAKLGYTSADLGNAAGNLFRGKQWKSNGYVTTARETGRGRKITRWEYLSVVGAALPTENPCKTLPQVPLLPGSKYIVETLIAGRWVRSANRTANGEGLCSLEFDTFEEADREAKYQQKASCFYRPYHAVEYRPTLKPLLGPVTSAPVVQTTKYIVQVGYLQPDNTVMKWYRSLNTFREFELNHHEFTDLALAEIAAREQHTNTNLKYRVVNAQTLVPVEPEPVLGPEAPPRVEVTLGSIRLGDRVAIGPKIATGLLRSSTNPNGVNIGDVGTVVEIKADTIPYPVEVRFPRGNQEVYKYHELVHV